MSIKTSYLTSNIWLSWGTFYIRKWKSIISFIQQFPQRKMSFIYYKDGPWTWGISGGENCLFYYESMDLNVFDVFKFIYSFWCVNHPSFVQQAPKQVGPEPFWWSLLASLLSRMTRYCWFIFYISWVCVLSCVQLFATPWTVAPPGYSVHGVFQARILEWVAVSSSRESSQPRDQTCISYISCIGRQILYHCATWKAISYPWPGINFFFLQEILSF